MKRLVTILSFLLCFCLLGGCTADSEFSAKEIADELKSYSADTVHWVELDRTKISTYFGFSDEKITDFKAYIGEAEEQFDMIAVFGFENDETRDAILSGIALMTGQMSENYKLANESISVKINGKTLAKTDEFIILCIMDQNKKVTAFLTDEVRAEIIS